MKTDERKFIHRIDLNDRIVSANENWFAFARENGAAEKLNPATVINRSLWDFISDDETRHLYEIVIKKIRTTGLVLTMPYRCDAPDRRRFMEMYIVRQPNDDLEFRNWIVREEPRAPMTLMDEKIQRTNEKLIVCGWCKKVQLPEGRWAEVEDAVAALGLFDAAKLPRISHGLCEHCRVNFMEKLMLPSNNISPPRKSFLDN